MLAEKTPPIEVYEGGEREFFVKIHSHVDIWASVASVSVPTSIGQDRQTRTTTELPQESPVPSPTYGQSATDATVVASETSRVHHRFGSGGEDVESGRNRKIDNRQEP